MSCQDLNYDTTLETIGHPNPRSRSLNDVFSWYRWNEILRRRQRVRERHRIRQPCKRQRAVEAKREREESVNRARDRKIERWSRMKVRENEITQSGKIIMRREIGTDAIYYWSRPLVLFYCVCSDASGRSKTLANVFNETRHKLDTRQEKERKREKMREKYLKNQR